MSLFGDTMDTLRRVVTLDQDVIAVKADLKELSLLHADTRERVMRLEGFIDAARMTLLPRRRD